MPCQPTPEPPDLTTDDPYIRLQVYQQQAQEKDFLKRIQADLDSGVSIKEVKFKLIVYMLYWPRNSRRFFWIPDLIKKLRQQEQAAQSIQ